MWTMTIKMQYCKNSTNNWSVIWKTISKELGLSFRAWIDKRVRILETNTYRVSRWKNRKMTQWDSYYGQLRRAFPGRQKSPPLVPLGLHGLFAGLRAILPAVVFFCHTFCNPPAFGTLLFLVSPLFKGVGGWKSNKPIHPQGKKDIRYSNRHHRTWFAPEKKTTPKLLYITCSYIRALAWRQINRAKYNLIMYNSRTKSTLCPATLPERPTIFPSSLSMVAVRKNRSSFISVCLR